MTFPCLKSVYACADTGLISNLQLDKELRLVKINLTSNERSIRALKPIPLKVDSLDELITAIRMQVLHAERDVSDLAVKMELPSNESRCAVGMCCPKTSHGLCWRDAHESG
jgi:hypothetical protein